jgi:hypothetical protein
MESGLQALAQLIINNRKSDTSDRSRSDVVCCVCGDLDIPAKKGGKRHLDVEPSDLTRSAMQGCPSCNLIVSIAQASIASADLSVARLSHHITKVSVER